METVRFEKFNLLIDGIHKSIGRVKNDTVLPMGIKSVHVFWLYKLMDHPDGLTAAELAGEVMIDRSLVSREIAVLKKEGYIHSAEGEGRRYNVPLVLTEAGRLLAMQIKEEGVKIQELVGAGITEDELSLFYSVLERIHNNFKEITN